MFRLGFALRGLAAGVPATMSLTKPRVNCMDEDMAQKGPEKPIYLMRRQEMIRFLALPPEETGNMSTKQIRDRAKEFHKEFKAAAARAKASSASASASGAAVSSASGAASSAAVSSASGVASSASAEEVSMGQGLKTRIRTLGRRPSDSRELKADIEAGSEQDLYMAVPKTSKPPSPVWHFQDAAHRPDVEFGPQACVVHVRRL